MKVAVLFLDAFSDSLENKGMLNVIINPATGAGRGIRIFKKVKPVFDNAGVRCRVYHSTRNKSISDIVSELSGQDIVLIGGDGSMNGALNGITDFEHTRIGLIPAGSGNDLAKALGLTKDPVKAAEQIAETVSEGGPVRMVDIGVSECGGRTKLFNISSGMGFDARTCFYADSSKLKGLLNRLGLGRLIYITVALRLIIKNEKFTCRIVTDTGMDITYRECLFAVGMNHRYEGGGFMFCPEAEDDDGLLDLCVVDGVNALRFLRMFPTALNGHHVRFPEIHMFKAKEIEIKSVSPCHIHTDGEAQGEERCLKLSLYKEKLRLLV